MIPRLLLCISLALSAFGQKKALVGGNLIDGYGGRPIPNSVILIDGEKIQAVGQVGTLPVPPDAQVISTEGLPPAIISDIRESLRHIDQLDYFRMVPPRKPTLKRKFQQLRESGAVLLIGTDSGVPTQFHTQTTWNEIDVWVRVMGVDAMDAIRAATFWPAVAMKVEREVGTVTPGKYADIIATRGDVLRHVDLLQNVDIVMKHGVRYK